MSVSVDKVPDFGLSVLWQKIKPAGSVKEFPQVVGGVNTLVDATIGRVGGLQSNGPLGLPTLCL